MQACYLNGYKCQGYQKLYLLIFFLIIFVIFSIYQGYEKIYQPLLAWDKPPVILTVKPLTTARDLIDELYDKKLISTRIFYQVFTKYSGYATHIKAGIYQILPGDSIIDVLNRLVQGKVLVLAYHLIAGKTLMQNDEQLKTLAYLVYQKTDWLTIKGNYLSAEGLALAETYYYQAGSNAKQLIKAAHQLLWSTLTVQWQNKSIGLPYIDSYQMLIAASIIEKEAALPHERYLISGVIVNRLKKNMPLQMDPTIIYALGDSYTGKLKHQDLKIASRFNTYRYRGLPPTPITMVSKASIEAAAHPACSAYLYYVAKGDGSHVFSNTYDEQRQAIAKYLK